MNSKERKQNFSGFSVRLTRDSRLFEDDGGFRELKAAHDELDLAVMDDYGLDADLLNQP